MLGQITWEVQHGPIRKKGFLPLTALSMSILTLFHLERLTRYDCKCHYQLLVSENQVKRQVRINLSYCIPIFRITNKNEKNKT